MSEKNNLKQEEYKTKANRTGFFKNIVNPLVLQRDGNKCTKCGSAKNLDIHHKHYNLSKLTYYDLITLCRRCHKIEHNEDK